MNVLIIGAGRVGGSMAYLMQKNGMKVMGVYNSSEESSKNAVEFIGSGSVINDETLYDIISELDFILITTPDDVIAEVANNIVKNYKIKENTCIMHMSGILPANIIEYDNIISLHPLQTVVNWEEGIKLLPNSVFTLEGTDKGIKYGKLIADLLNLNYHLIDSNYKSLYHAAAVMSSNYFITLINLSYKLLDKSNILNKDLKKGILTLVKGAVNNLEKMDPEEALTGPIKRGDIQSIKRHQKALEKYPEILDIYNIMGKETASMINKDEILELFNNRRGNI